jgi:ABC-2 type transport system permease protein
VLFWLLLGSGLRASFQPPGLPAGAGYLQYLYPGVVALVLLFTAIFATISIVEDRQEGFLQGVLVAPVPRFLIVLGQALGGTTLALFQGALFLLLAPLAGIALRPGVAIGSLAAMALLALEMNGLGLIIAWRLDSTRGFHAVMNLILMPLWLLSGAFFPAEGAPAWLSTVMRINPLTYGVAVLRHALEPGGAPVPANLPPLAASIAVSLVCCAATLTLATRAARRRRV